MEMTDRLIAKTKLQIESEIAGFILERAYAKSGRLDDDFIREASDALGLIEAMYGYRVAPNEDDEVMGMHPIFMENKDLYANKQSKLLRLLYLSILNESDLQQPYGQQIFKNLISFYLMKNDKHMEIINNKIKSKPEDLIDAVNALFSGISSVLPDFSTKINIHSNMDDLIEPLNFNGVYLLDSEGNKLSFYDLHTQGSIYKNDLLLSRKGLEDGYSLDPVFVHFASLIPLFRYPEVVELFKKTASLKNPDFVFHDEFEKRESNIHKGFYLAKVLGKDIVNSLNAESSYVNALGRSKQIQHHLDLLSRTDLSEAVNLYEVEFLRNDRDLMRSYFKNLDHKDRVLYDVQSLFDNYLIRIDEFLNKSVFKHLKDERFENAFNLVSFSFSNMSSILNALRDIDEHNEVLVRLTERYYDSVIRVSNVLWKDISGPFFNAVWAKDKPESSHHMSDLDFIECAKKRAVIENKSLGAQGILSLSIINQMVDLSNLIASSVFLDECFKANAQSYYDNLYKQYDISILDLSALQSNKIEGYFNFLTRSNNDDFTYDHYLNSRSTVGKVLSDSTIVEGDPLKKLYISILGMEAEQAGRMFLNGNNGFLERLNDCLEYYKDRISDIAFSIRFLTGEYSRGAANFTTKRDTIEYFNNARESIPKNNPLLEMAFYYAYIDSLRFPTTCKVFPTAKNKFFQSIDGQPFFEWASQTTRGDGSSSLLDELRQVSIDLKSKSMISWIEKGYDKYLASKEKGRGAELESDLDHDVL